MLKDLGIVIGAFLVLMAVGAIIGFALNGEDTGRPDCIPSNYSAC